MIIKNVVGFFRYKNLNKLSNNLKPFTVAWVLPEGRGGFVNAKVVTQTINNFCSSSDEYVGPQHVPERYKNTTGREECLTEAKKKVCRYPRDPIDSLCLSSLTFVIFYVYVSFPGVCT